MRSRLLTCAAAAALLFVALPSVAAMEEIGIEVPAHRDGDRHEGRIARGGDPVREGPEEERSRRHDRAHAGEIVELSYGRGGRMVADLT